MDTHQKIENHQYLERKRMEEARNEAARDFAEKMETAKRSINDILMIAKQKIPGTVQQIEARIQSLDLSRAAESVALVESAQNRDEQQMESLRQQFSEAQTQVAQSRSDLENVIRSMQSAILEQHSGFLNSVKSILSAVELAIEGRQCTFDERIIVLQAPASPLSTQKFLISQDEIPLDKAVQNLPIFPRKVLLSMLPHIPPECRTHKLLFRGTAYKVFSGRLGDCSPVLRSAFRIDAPEGPLQNATLMADASEESVSTFIEFTHGDPYEFTPACFPDLDSLADALDAEGFKAALWASVPGGGQGPQVLISLLQCRLARGASTADLEARLGQCVQDLIGGGGGGGDALASLPLSVLDRVLGRVLGEQERLSDELFGFLVGLLDATGDRASLLFGRVRAGSISAAQLAVLRERPGFQWGFLGQHMGESLSEWVHGLASLRSQFLEVRSAVAALSAFTAQMRDEFGAFRAHLQWDFVAHAHTTAALEERIAELERRAQARESVITALQGELGQLSVSVSRGDQSRLGTSVDEVREQVSELLKWRAQLPPLGFASLIVADFPAIFAEFREKRFSLLWRGSRDGFGARDFHERCDGRATTLTLIQDTEGNIFGGFTPVEWESREWYWKADPSLKSFVFTLKNPHNLAARKFALTSPTKAIYCDPGRGPCFGWTSLDPSYVNDTGLGGKTVFTGSEKFTVKEIEVFEIAD
jgi:uncharacterized coiled-coil protein SlyX